MRALWNYAFDWIANIDVGDKILGGKFDIWLAD